MRYIFLFAVISCMLHAQDGAQLYKQRCAACHEAPSERVPSLASLKKMSGEAIYIALTHGTMKTQAADLSSAEIFALIRYIAPASNVSSGAPKVTPTCKAESTFSRSASLGEWSGWSPNLTNSRFQSALSARLTDTEVPKLKLKWAFNLGEVAEARSQPVIVGGRVFIGSNTGMLYSLDSNSGCTFWGFRADSPLRGGVTVAESKNQEAVFFADSGANVYAVNAETGALIWKVRPVDHFATIATATPAYYNGVVYQPFSSFEEAIAADPKYQCCTFRGTVVALNASTGERLWQFFAIQDAPKATHMSAAGSQQFGPSGAGIWSSPTIDEQAGALYVATGDNYSDPATNTSDAVLALDLKTGNLLWSAQLTTNDAFNNACGIPIPGNCPSEHGADSDFGQPPILISVDQGKRELVIAQKSGMVHAIDPDSRGKLLWQTRVGQGGPLGGSQWGSASDGDRVYVAISDLGLHAVPDAKSTKGYRLVLDPTKGGGLHALKVKTGEVIWSAARVPCAVSRS
ncbi:MAG: PQQ-binding-like beta-propeller repeat protein, partial [Acidobacteria bacterium]|nr:PQQ-binding-like beta-propeller repeat protein [Acidobacteriota bacterium]